MRPVREIPEEFFSSHEQLGEEFELVEDYLKTFIRGAAPLEGLRFLLVQHQLTNHLALVSALIRMGANAEDMTWLDIPYTSNADVRAHACSNLGLLEQNFRTSSDYKVLEPYDPYQHQRTVKTIIELAERSKSPLIVLDDGAYVLKALSVLLKERWPHQIAIVEQTTQGLIKIAASAAMRAVSKKIPFIDVASSEPKQTLEPPFIAMDVCASLDKQLRVLLRGRSLKSALILGYGTIGEQVATYLSAHFRLSKKRICVYDPRIERMMLAWQRDIRPFIRDDLAKKFDLVVGCSGNAAFKLGDREYLEDGAFLLSASSGSVELSRRAYLELAEAVDGDDVEILDEGLNHNDVHSNIQVKLVDKTATVMNGGYPINFSGNGTLPKRFIQQIPTMMAAAAVRAAESLTEPLTSKRIDPDGKFDAWIDSRFREILGEDAHYLEPPAEEAW